MNKQIETLLGQALDSAVPETWTTLTPEQFTKVSEKFAELIVRECAEVADNPDIDILRIGKTIKQHFGVRE